MLCFCHESSIAFAIASEKVPLPVRGSRDHQWALEGRYARDARTGTGSPPRPPYRYRQPFDAGRTGTGGRSASGARSAERARRKFCYLEAGGVDLGALAASA